VHFTAAGTNKHRIQRLGPHPPGFRCAGAFGRTDLAHPPELAPNILLTRILDHTHHIARIGDALLPLKHPRQLTLRLQMPHPNNAQISLAHSFSNNSGATRPSVPRKLFTSRSKIANA